MVVIILPYMHMSHIHVVTVVYIMVYICIQTGLPLATVLSVSISVSLIVAFTSGLLAACLTCLCYVRYRLKRASQRMVCLNCTHSPTSAAAASGLYETAACKDSGLYEIAACKDSGLYETAACKDTGLYETLSMGEREIKVAHNSAYGQVEDLAW